MEDRARLASVNVEAVSVEIFDGELPDAPRFIFEGIHDVGAGRFHFEVDSIDVSGEDPVDRRLKWGLPLAEEYCYWAARHGSNVVGRI